MTIEEAKNIRLVDYLHSLGYTPVRQQGANLWYKSPFREETEASFKVNTEINKWYDFGLGQGGNIIALASELYSSVHVPYLLQRIAEQIPRIRPVSFSFREQSSTQYIIARHNDQKHPHVHIVFNRVDNNGRTISDRNDCYRNIKVCKELKEKYGLYFGKGKDRVRTHRLKGSDKTKYEIYHAVKNSLGKSNSWKQFISELSKPGIKTEFKYRGRSNVIQGLSFTKDGITFKASDIDRSFSYSKLDRQLKETNSHSQRSIRMATNGSHQPAMQHENTYNSGNDVVESIAGAFGGLFNPAPNYGDENAEAAFQRKLKKKKKRRINW